jgi:hypothetical protein
MDLANLRLKLLSDLAQDKIVELLGLGSWDQIIASAIENRVDLVDHIYSFLSKDPTNAVGGLTLDTVRIVCSPDCISPKQEYIDQLRAFVYRNC